VPVSPPFFAFIKRRFRGATCGSSPRFLISTSSNEPRVFEFLWRMPCTYLPRNPTQQDRDAPLPPNPKWTPTPNGSHTKSSGIHRSHMKASKAKRKGPGFLKAKTKGPGKNDRWSSGLRPGCRLVSVRSQTPVPSAGIDKLELRLRCWLVANISMHVKSL